MGLCSITGCVNEIRYKKAKLCNTHYLRMLRHGTFSKTKTSAKEAHQWLLRHVRYKNDDCLCWPYGKTTAGYGQLAINGNNRPAHRIMCYMANGNPPQQNLLALHDCGKGHLGCVNPKHLYWGNNSQNQLDRIRHNTCNRGSRNGRSKLIERDVIEIVNLLNTGFAEEEIADMYKVHKKTINDIYKGRRWSWLTKRSEI